MLQIFFCIFILKIVCFTFKSMVLVKFLWKILSLDQGFWVFSPIDVQLLHHHLLKMLCFCHWMALHLCQASVGQICVGLCLDCLFCSVGSMSLTLSQYPTILISSSYICLEIGWTEFSHLLFLFENCFHYFTFFTFPNKY